jgi:hypothetical protein
MLTPLINKNSLEKTGFQLTPTGFVVRGGTYSFNDVVSVRSSRIVPGARRADARPAITLTVSTSDGHKVNVAERPTWTSSSRRNLVDYLEGAFEEICEQTFDHRAQRYVDQVARLGFFDYAGWRFFPSQRSVLDMRTGASFAVSRTEFRQQNDSLQLVDRDEGEFRQWLRLAKEALLRKPSHTINTSEDTDVFHALLSHYFHLRWR